MGKVIAGCHNLPSPYILAPWSSNLFVFNTADIWYFVTRYWQWQVSTTMWTSKTLKFDGRSFICICRTISFFENFKTRFHASLLVLLPEWNSTKRLVNKMPITLGYHIMKSESNFIKISNGAIGICLGGEVIALYYSIIIVYKVYKYTMQHQCIYYV